jgi:phosphate transport system substrate-binding protein
MLLASMMIFSLAALARAQETPLRIAGSSLAEGVISPFVSAVGINATVTVTGSTPGLSEFCRAGNEIALSARPITPQEESACTINGTVFHEFLLGHNLLTLVVRSEDGLPQCLSAQQLNSLLAPSASATNWQGTAGEGVVLPFTLILPPENTVAYALLDERIGGVGLRAGTVQTDRNALLAAVAETPGALGVTTAGRDPLPDGLRAVQLDSGTSGCADATAAAAEDRTYIAANRLFAYVNAAHLEAARPLLAALFADSALADLALADYTPPTATALARNRTILDSGLTGRQFSREVTAFSIPQNLVGQISIAGSLDAKPYIDALNAAFSAGQPGVTITYTPQGVVSGIQRFCNGEIQIVTTFAPLTDEQLAACAQNDVIPETFTLGAFAPVLVMGSQMGDVENPVVCLTTAEAATVWAAGGASTWNAVRADFPEQAITLFTPRGGSLTRDLLTLGAPTSSVPRADVEENSDPAYRAAAVANVPGGITFMNVTEFATLPVSEAARVRALQVDGGSGCISATPETLIDGSYPLARPALLLVRRSAIGRQDVQSYLWFAFSDANYPLLGASGLNGVLFSDLAERRAALEALYPIVAQEVADSIAAAAAQTEATPEADATPELQPPSGGNFPVATPTSSG